MRYFQTIMRIVLVISVLVIIVVAIVQVPKRVCSSIQVDAHTQNESVLLTPTDVKTLLDNAGIEIIGKKMKEVDLSAVTQKINANPYVAKVNFIRFAGTKLLIDYDLRHIVLHVYNQNGDQYFVDSDGELVPYTEKMQDYLMIANGNIQQSYKKGGAIGKQLTPILNVAQKIMADDFYNAQFRQIYLNEHNQMELIATIGNQLILFGSDQDADEKLANLKEVYKNGLSRKGYDTYAMLDARYKNRIIAQRKQ